MIIRKYPLGAVLAMLFMVFTLVVAVNIAFRWNEGKDAIDSIAWAIMVNTFLFLYLKNWWRGVIKIDDESMVISPGNSTEIAINSDSITLIKFKKDSMYVESKDVQFVINGLDITGKSQDIILEFMRTRK